ncbi:hypothetical protein RM697_06845 [Ichthyenterobacterium sp. W332]|uniref:Adenosine deaminase domain-containing protein n=1 Tax=Microcosmobacter mediterraneus TaxID=3075607 RepID=A0ABU2YM61_9FLAO|nr:hypothetical protein [Ichthyenterobacterium sp. W332]MDT0558355.1 hypothetical protein [Ichthyenterobacterium sp. W332]
MNTSLTSIKDIYNTPKADVHSHLHLSGTRVLLKKYYPDADLVFPKSYDGLPGMIDFIYGHLNTIMQKGKDVECFMEMAIIAAIEDNITLLEASVDVGLARFFDNSIDHVIGIVAKLKAKYDSRIDFKPDIGVNKDLDLEKIYSDGVKCIKSGVFSNIDFYGKEDKQDLKPFVKFYNMARDYNLKTKVHIGEFSDCNTIENTINQLQPNEIQHGIRAVDSKKVMDLILKHNIRLNICPESNVALGAVNSLKEHPIKQLFNYGINVTVSTDDLLLFNTTVSKQFEDLYNEDVFNLDEINTIRLNGF